MSYEEDAEELDLMQVLQCDENDQLLNKRDEEQSRNVKILQAKHQTIACLYLNNKKTRATLGIENSSIKSRTTVARQS